MKVYGYVCAVFVLGAVLTTAGFAAQGPAPKPGGGKVAAKGSGKAGKQEPGGGKGSASINGTGVRGSSSSVNGTGMGAQH